MSELTTATARTPIRHALLLTVSATTLLSLVLPALADENARPTVWIELGGQWNSLSGQPEKIIPLFTVVGEQHGLISAADVQSAPRSSIGETGQISFQPTNSDWNFSASVQYGRSSRKQYRHEENRAGAYLNPPIHFEYIYGTAGIINQTADYSAKSNESHAIVDFAVGKDVGLGLWKQSVSSQISFGVRFAQFTAKSSINLRGDPYPHRSGFKYFTPSHASIPFNAFRQYYKATPEMSRSFRGWGPSISWNGSVPVIQSGGEDAEVAFDWGANVGVLFGRQKAHVHHHTSGNLYTLRPFDALSGLPKYTETHYVNSASVTRSRSVVVPNVGGLAGFSLKFSNAKISLGYRADFFFGAMDGGIDARKTYDRDFYGPFATISIGLGG